MKRRTFRTKYIEAFGRSLRDVLIIMGIAQGAGYVFDHGADRTVIFIVGFLAIMPAISAAMRK